ncbi:MAG: glycosyltransferase family 4 protein [Lachnospiraceae bacterium]|nr:glycosyltransferase family 4 protein [Lachnospiraceae bacterium]
MRVLWVCNFIPPILAQSLSLKAGNKEGWVTGMMSTLLREEEVTLGVTFPVSKETNLSGQRDGIFYYGFHEDNMKADVYDQNLEAELGYICENFSPDVIHVFGTEYPHTLALLKQKEWRKRTLVHLQGLMIPCTEVYEAGLPKEVVERATFRDVLKRDAIWQQKEKFRARGKNETAALKLAMYVAGRTEFDKQYVESVNPDAVYYMLNETLRPTFYGPVWKRENAVKHRIFASQGNYPLKGVHFLLEAMPMILQSYPDATLTIAGDKITAYGTLKEKLKISSYGKYLRELIVKNHLEEAVTFTGNINGKKMLQEYLSSEAFVLTSVLENSPNSLGEAMILGMPIVSTNVGGVPSLAEDEKEVLLCEKENAQAIADKIRILFANPEEADERGRNARSRAMRTHDAMANYKMLHWIYESIMSDL